MARADGGERKDRSKQRDNSAGPRQAAGSPNAFGRADGEKGPDLLQYERPETNSGRGDGKEIPLPKSKPFYKRPLIVFVLAVVLIGSVAGGIAYWSYSRRFETTDDAFVDAHITTVSPKVAGLVVDVPPDVDDNRPVTAGQKLLQIDPRDFDLQIQSARAALLSAQGKLEQSQAQEKVSGANAASARADVLTGEANSHMAANDLKRYAALDPRGVSKQQLDSATAQAESTSAIVEADRKKADAADAMVKFAGTQSLTAKADVESAKVNLANAELQRSYTTILAPVAGWVTRKDVHLGMYVQVAQALLSVVPPDVFVTANFKETQLARMHPGDRVDIEVDAFPGRRFHGHVDSVQKGSGARFSLLPPENATGNYVKVVQRIPVKIVFDEKVDELKGLGPGMSVTPKVRVAQ